MRELRLGLGVLALSLHSVAPAAIFRCAGADGTTAFSDHPCETVDKNSRGAAQSTTSLHPLPGETEKEKKAARIMDLMRLAPREPEQLVIRRTVDDTAPELVRSLDPDNPAWDPTNSRWRYVSDFVKSDLRHDVQSAIRSSTAQTAHVVADQYVVRASESDMDGLLAFLNSADGARFIAFQNEIRPLLYSALSALMAQEPVRRVRPRNRNCSTVGSCWH